MSPTIQENIRAKAAREAADQQEQLPAPQAPGHVFRDDELCTVLYGFGRVLPTSVSLLDGYEVRGGIIRDVPYSVAKHWQNGTRPDGQKPHGRVKVTILPASAGEDDFASAVGLSTEQRRKMAALITAGDASHLLSDLGPERARELRDALSNYLEHP
jgi:hypothetical protein